MPSQQQAIETDAEPGPPRWIMPLRDRVHGMPAGVLVWRIVIAVVGALLVGVGLLLIPLPGPGWAIVFVGLAVWATEFVWAQRLLVFARRTVRSWTDWALRQSLAVRALLAVAGVAVLLGVFYLGWLLLRG